MAAGVKQIKMYVSIPVLSKRIDSGYLARIVVPRRKTADTIRVIDKICLLVSFSLKSSLHRKTPEVKRIIELIRYRMVVENSCDINEITK